MKTLKELIIEYTETDSISKREELKPLIEDKCSEYITAKGKIGQKYGINVLDDRDYRPESDSWNFTQDSYIGYTNTSIIPDDCIVDLYNKDYWSYGSYIFHTFEAKEVDNFDPVKYEKACQAKKRNLLKRKIVDIEYDSLEAQKKLEVFELSLKNNE